MVQPIHISFESWAASLIVDFPNDNIPIYKEGMDWKVWGNIVVQENSFSENGAPGTEHFSEPLEWAVAVYRQMGNFA